MTLETINHWPTESDRDRSEGLFDKYHEANDLRQQFDQMGCDYCWQLQQELVQSEPRPYQIKALVDEINYQERIVAETELMMRSYELQSGRNPDDSLLYNETSADLLVKSAILYHYRINQLKQVTDNHTVGQSFAKSVTNYFVSIDDMMTWGGSVKEMEWLNINRIRAHNEVIRQLNQLNDLCSQNGLRPLTYRNFTTSSRSNNYRNNLQQAHDRATVANYIAELLEVKSEANIKKVMNPELKIRQMQNRVYLLLQ